MSAPIPHSQALFTSRLLQPLTADSANVAVSPLSVLLVLSVAYTNAPNETRADFNELVGFDGEPDTWDEYMSMLMTQMNAENKPYTLDTATKVYLRAGFNVTDEFALSVDKYYSGALEELDLSDQNEAVNRINEFVANKTNDKIKNIVSHEQINDATRMILINALYFKSRWENEFNPNKTSDQLFFVKSDTAQRVKMMKQKSDFIYFDDQQVQVLGMPYAGEGVYMFVILPHDKFGLDDVLNSTTPDQLSKYIGLRYKTEVNVELPKFRVDSKLTLNDALKAAGLERPFGPSADFSHISEEKLKIDQIVHEVFLETNEQGSEAAAASGVVMIPLSASFNEEEIFFKADHPFWFVISTKYNDILFSGVVREV